MGIGLECTSPLTQLGWLAPQPSWSGIRTPKPPPPGSGSGRLGGDPPGLEQEPALTPHRQPRLGAGPVPSGSAACPTARGLLRTAAAQRPDQEQSRGSGALRGFSPPSPRASRWRERRSSTLLRAVSRVGHPRFVTGEGSMSPGDIA